MVGGTLFINAAPAHGGGSPDWSATTLAPDIAEVVSVSPGSPGITLELAFHRPGTTDLFVTDEAGTILAARPLRVREPAQAALIAWSDLIAHDPEPLPDTIHLVPGSATSLAVSWRDALDTPLSGGDLLTLDASTSSAAVDFTPRFTGEADVIDVDVENGASEVSFEITLGAPTVSFVRSFEIHPRSDADRLEITEDISVDDEGGDVTGQVAAAVYAGQDRLVGAPVAFSWDNEPPVEGTVLSWSTKGGGPTEVNACFASVCESFEVEGVPTDVWNPRAPTGGCGGVGAVVGAVGCSGWAWGCWRWVRVDGAEKRTATAVLHVASARPGRRCRTSTDAPPVVRPAAVRRVRGALPALRLRRTPPRSPASVRPRPDRRPRTAQAERRARRTRVAPLIEDARQAFEGAVRRSHWVDAAVHLTRILRLEVAAPSLLLPDHDYEGTVVRPAVEDFAREHGVEIDW